MPHKGCRRNQPWRRRARPGHPAETEPGSVNILSTKPRPALHHISPQPTSGIQIKRRWSIAPLGAAGPSDRTPVFLGPALCERSVEGDESRIHAKPLSVKARWQTPIMMTTTDQRPSINRPSARGRSCVHSRPMPRLGARPGHFVDSLRALDRVFLFFPPCATSSVA